MSVSKELSIIIPAYNEAERIQPSLQRIRDLMKNESIPWELLVVDDGSRDGTHRIVEEFSKQCSEVRVIRLHQNCGKGKAVKEGALAAVGQFILITDADLAAPFNEWHKLKAKIDEGYDGIVGTRAIADSNTVVKQSGMRKLSSRIFNLIVCALILKDFSDTQCGFKLFRNEVLKRACKEQSIDGFSFDIELLYLMKKFGYRLAEVPINWTAQPGSKVRLLSDSISMMRDILFIRKKHGKLD